MANFRTCKISGCDRPHYGHDLCYIHHRRRERGQSMNRPFRYGNNRIKTCSVEGCNNRHFAKNYCHIHYQRWKRHGDPLKTLRGISRSPGATVKPTIKDIYWASGFMEGEACFCGIKGKCVVQVEQVNKEPLNRLLQIFGGKIRLRNYSNKNRSDIWVWYVYGERARGLMMTLSILMSSRRFKQIRKSLELAKQVRLRGIVDYAISG